MIPRDNESWRRAMGEAVALPPDDPMRVEMQGEVARLGAWAEKEWLALLEEGERWRIELRRLDVPEGLEERLLRIPEERLRGRLPVLSLRAWALVAAAVVLVGLGVWLAIPREVAPPPDPLQTLAMLAMNDHLDTHTLDVKAEDAATLREGLKHKIPFEIRVPDLGGALRLEGGRRCTLGSHAVCFTTWRDASGRFTLLQLRVEDFGLPAVLPLLARVFERKSLFRKERGPVQIAAAQAAARLPRDVGHGLLTMLSVDADPGVAGVARDALARHAGE